MSGRHNQRVTFWEDVRVQLGRGRYTLDGGRVLSKRQVRVLVDAYWCMLAIWSDTCGTLPARVIRSTVTGLKNTPVVDFCKLVKELDSILIDEVRYSPVPNLQTRFKHAWNLFPVNEALIASLKHVIGVVLLREKDTVQIFAKLHQIFSFIGRLNLPDRKDLAREGLAEYREKERELRMKEDLPLPPVANIVRHRVTGWFPNTIQVYEDLYGDWVPKHGNGSVAEPWATDVAKKYLAFAKDGDLDYLDLFTGGIGYCRPIPDTLDRTSRLRFVPKNVLKERSISMEPAILQFYQQGCMRSILSYINRHNRLSKRIDLGFAAWNTELAMEGSIDGTFATIDLSAASDSVSLALVRFLFGGTPVEPMLEHTRSTHTLLPDGCKLALRKFAPMGSALCFPVECIVFAAITEAGILLSPDAPTHPALYADFISKSGYRVYGDDIIVENRFVPYVVDVLTQLGFKVNTDKSYWDNGEYLHYRESCGGEYILGYDVTPLRIPRRFSGVDPGYLRRNSSAYEGLIDLANGCYGRFPLLRALLINQLNKLKARFRPLFVGLDEEGGIQSPTPTNYRLLSKEFIDPHSTPLRYQRTIYKHGCVKKPKYKWDEAVEDIRLYDCLRRTSIRKGDSELSDSDTFICRRTQGPYDAWLGTTWTI